MPATRIQRFLGGLSLLLLASLAQSATITVDTLAGSGGPNNDCALDHAVLSASLNIGFGGCDAGSSIGTDTIVFDPALFGGGSATIDLDGTLAASGSGLTIEGPSGADLVVNGNGSGPVLTMNLVTAAELTLRNFSLNNGTASGADGAGVRVLSGNAGDLRLESMILDGHHTDMNGGAIGGEVVELININIDGSVFSNNSAGIDGGAIAIRAANGTTAQLFVRTSSFDSNSALGGGGAIHMTGEAGSLGTTFNLQVSDSVFTGNSADRGGAVQMPTSSSNHMANMTLVANRFGSNTASGAGGAISGQVTDSATDAGIFDIRRNTFTNNVAGSVGGAFSSQNQNVVLSNNLIAENSADRGGGIYITYVGLEAVRQASVYANTFIENFADTQYFDWYFSLPSDSSLTDSRLEANLTRGLVTGGELNCWAPQPADVSAANIANEPIFGPCAINGMLVPDTGVSLAAVTHPVHEQAAIPVFGSPAVDAWPETDCIRDSGSDLNNDLLGDRRESGTGIPLDGDGDGIGNCDVGAFESPTVVLQELNVSIVGDGSGTVISNPVGIDCPGTCQSGFPDGDGVELHAAPAVGSAFTGWSGNCSGTGACNVTMNQARSVTATFVSTIVTHPVDVELDGNGVGMVTSVPAGIDCPADCSEAFEDGTSINLSAIAGASSEFLGWRADCSFAGSGACQLTVEQAYRAIAIFGDGDLMFLDGFE